MPNGQTMNTMQASTIEDVMGVQNFGSSQGKGSGIGVELKNGANYSNYEVGAGPPSKSNSVHIAQ